MKSSNVGGNITAILEVINVSKHAFWLHLDGEEFFLPFAKYPWFESAPARSIFNLELLHGYHLRWPDLDVDLELDSLREPETYPLRFDPL